MSTSTKIISIILIVSISLAGTVSQVAQARSQEQANQEYLAARLDPTGSMLSAASQEALTMMINLVSPGLGAVMTTLESPQVSGLDIDVLMAASVETADADADTIPDSVEAILGTSPEKADTDLDQLDDYYEAHHGLDPLRPDSNEDGLADYLEIARPDGSLAPGLDSDGDGDPNAWDDDNDGDGVPDSFDLSPFSYTDTRDSFPFTLKTNGNPTYADFQIRPAGSTSLDLPLQPFNWPDNDIHGAIQDTDDSTHDMKLVPMLQLQATWPVNYTSEMEASGYGIVNVNGNPYIPLTQVKEQGQTVALSGRLFFPSTSNPANQDVQFNAWLRWILMSTSEKSDLAWSDRVMVPNPLLSENAGGGSASGDINGNDSLDVVFMAIDSPEGANHFQYMIGYDLDTTGAATSWSERKGVPVDLNPYTVGGGAALADIDGNGVLDLLLMALSHTPDYRFEFVYLVGYDLDSSGTPAHWSSLYTCPHTVGTAEGGGAALADLDGNGQLDLLFMAVETTGGAFPESQFRYVIGHDIGPAGWIEGPWSPLLDGPEVDPTSNGGGAEIADLNANGIPDILFMVIDDLSDENRFDYVIGWDIGLSGQPASDWSPVFQSQAILDKNQGGGVVLADIDENGLLDLLCMGIDAPDGRDNQFLYRIGWDIETETTTIGRYNEPFYFTGFRFEENYGSEVGLFYNNDVKSTTYAYVTLRYEFLGSQATIAEAAATLPGHNVLVDHVIHTYSHTDEALYDTASVQTGAVLDGLPGGQKLPITYALQDVSADVQLTDFGEGIVTLNSYGIDVAVQPQATTKSLKLGIYDTDSQVQLDVGEYDELVLGWATNEGWNEEETENTLKALVVFDKGETKWTKLGINETDFEPPEGNEVMDWIAFSCDMGFLFSLPVYAKGLGIFLASWSRAMQTPNGFNHLAKSASATANVVKGVGVAPGGIQKMQTTLGRSLKMAEMGKLSTFSKVAKALSVIGYVVTAAIAFYAFYTIADANGWSGFGIALGALYVGLMVLQMIVMELIAMIPVVGGIIALLALISDYIVRFITGEGWSDRAVTWIMEQLVEYNQLADVDLQLNNTSLEIADGEDGVNPGETIRLTMTAVGTISRTSDGEWEDVEDSHIHANLIPQADPVEFTFHSPWHPTVTESGYPDWRRETTDLEVWFEPLKTGINLAATVHFSVGYGIRYEQCVAGECWKEVMGGNSDQAVTFWFDVLPASFTELMGTYLGPLAISMDQDGDGLVRHREGNTFYTNEVAADGSLLATLDTQWDTDGDGLGDAFELDLGSDPTNPDSDLDGLPDGAEYTVHSDFLQPDTDGDGLLDGLEQQGWTVTINYCDRQLYDMFVRSDPTLPDTDGDGLTDAQEYDLLYANGVKTNPLSQDTDGDGVGDLQDGFPTYWQQVIAVADAYIVAQNGALTVDAEHGLLANDKHTADTWAVEQSTPGYGALVLNRPTGAFTYTPNPGYFGTDSFTYKAIDLGGIESEIATVTITVTKEAPTVTVHPANQTITYGDDASFSAAASGAPELAVQWQESRDAGNSWNDLPGATATTLLLTQPAVADTTNQYRAIFSNDFGSDATHPATLVVNPAGAAIQVIGYSGSYDGAAHGASGSATGVDGEDLSTYLNLGDSFIGVPGGTAHWTFTGSGNYQDQSGSVLIEIQAAGATCAISGYSGVYDASSHGATGACTGVNGETLAGLDLGSSFTDVPGGTANWTFTDVTGNYLDQSGSVLIEIQTAGATCAISGYNGVYDASSHGATGSCTGVNGETLAGLDLGSSFTDVPGGTANWTFTDVTGNYLDQDGSVAIVITQATLMVAADNLTMILNGAVPALTYSILGFASGEDQSLMDILPTCTTNATTSSPVGSYAITCSGGWDNNYNFTYQAGTLRIIYAVGGMCLGSPSHQILNPINADGSSIFRKGSSVPAKFRVCDANGESISTAGLVTGFHLVKIITSTKSTDTYEEVESATAYDEFRWSAVDQLWIFNISTKKLSSGRIYRYRINLNDDSTIEFQFVLR